MNFVEKQKQHTLDLASIDSNIGSEGSDLDGNER